MTPRAPMSARSLLDDNRQIQRAIRMIQLGARLQMLQSETALPYERLLKLYKEVAGRSPSKGQLPFSADWFMTWQPNIHSSLFYNIHRPGGCDEVLALRRPLHQPSVRDPGAVRLRPVRPSGACRQGEEGRGDSLTPPEAPSAPPPTGGRRQRPGEARSAPAAG